MLMWTYRAPKDSKNITEIFFRCCICNGLRINAGKMAKVQSVAALRDENTYDTFSIV